MLSTLIFAFFALFWAVLGFFALRLLAQRYFHEPRRAAVFSAGVVIAFLAGSALPLAGWTGGARGGTEDAVRASYAGPHDVSATCRGANLSGTLKNLGNVDGIGEIRDGRQVAEPTGFVADRTATLWLTGWAADVPGKVPARAVCLVVDGRLDQRAAAGYGAGRVDVATAYHVDALAATGFMVSIPVSDLSSGAHRVTVAAVLASGETDPISSNWIVRVP